MKIPPKKKTPIGLVLWSDRITVKVCRLKDLGRLNAGECATLSESLKQSKSKFPLTASTPCDGNGMATNDEIELFFGYIRRQLNITA